MIISKTIVYYKYTLIMMKKYGVLPYYKTCYRNSGSRSRLRDSKPRNNALHAFCGIETIAPAALAAATKRVFLNHAPLPRANIN